MCRRVEGERSRIVIFVVGEWVWMLSACIRPVREPPTMMACWRDWERDIFRVFAFTGMVRRIGEEKWDVVIVIFVKVR